MKYFASVAVLVISLFLSVANAAGTRGTFGVNVGLGVPFVSQVGANLYFTDNLGIDVGYNNLSLSVEDAKVELTMPEVLLKWHPFGGSFFIAGGLGKEELKATATSNNQTAEIKVNANTTVGKVGWMWGSAGGGFWFGMDLSYIKPSSPETTITSNLPPSDPAYQDALEQSEKFGEKAYTNITLAKFGWLF